jgi:hypothetical protein
MLDAIPTFEDLSPTLVSGRVRFASTNYSNVSLKFKWRELITIVSFKLNLFLYDLRLFIAFISGLNVTLMIRTLTQLGINLSVNFVCRTTKS